MPTSSGKPLLLTDPRQMRALAHPARIAILQHLALEGPATATECAAIAGLSPSACSYHLRTLARYGFVEEDRSAADDGRERPWRAKVAQLEIDTGPGTPPAVRAAGRLLEDSYRASVEELRERYIRSGAEYPQQWHFGTTYSPIYVTPEELSELRQRLVDMFSSYMRPDPAERPDGGGRVMLAADFFPTFPPDEAGQ